MVDIPAADEHPQDSTLNEEENELKDQILNHINENRISQLISFMLNSIVSKYDEEMQPEMFNMLQGEIKEALFSKINDMLEALFTDNLDEWLRLLMIESPNQPQLDYYEQIRDLILKTSKLKHKVTLDNIDDIAKMVRSF